MENTEESATLRITPTVRALSSALRGKRDDVPDSSQLNGDRIFPEPEKLWFKESSAKNLRNRDFLSPTTMLNTLYADGQVHLTDTCWVGPSLNRALFAIVASFLTMKEAYFVCVFVFNWNHGRAC